jgi:uncharacterized protein YndB with AHSA1/START domain
VIGAGSQELTVTRRVRAGRDRVFETWTDPDMIPRWWGAGGVTCPEAEVDLRVGGSYRIANQTPDGDVLWVTGTFRHIEPPARLVYTWTTEPVTGDSRHSLVEVTFDEASDGTIVTITETRIADTETRDVHLHGWLGCLDGLDQLLVTSTDGSDRSGR